VEGRTLQVGEKIVVAVDLNELKEKKDAPELVEVETAFLVVIRGGGMIQASPNIDQSIKPLREATVDDMQMACYKVGEDIQAMKTAQVVQMELARTAMAAQEAAANRQLMENLKF
jgi:hypothetical protein